MTMIPITRWEVAQPRALVHVVHGMTEHAGRYARLATALNAAGLTVWAHDHRGHGDHLAADGTRRPGDLGEDGWEGLIGDTQHVSKMLQESAPGTPLLMFAHSMGSFVAQAVITRSGREYAGVVLCGSNGPPGRLEATARALARLELHVRGATTPSRWGHDSVFRRYNAAFRPTRTASDWLSRDPAEVDAYIADPRCAFALTNGSWCDFLSGKAGLGDATVLRRIPTALPVHLMAGDRDPVGEDGAGVTRLLETYRQAGLRRVSMRLYPGARHELVNETNRDEVTRDLVAWIDDVLATRAPSA